MISIQDKLITDECNLFRRGHGIDLIGFTLLRCNLSQENPHTPVFPGVTGLTIEDCNCVNCDFPAGTTVIGGLHIHREPEPEPVIDDAERVRTAALEHLEPLKPLAYENPLAVKQAISEAFTPEEIGGVFGAGV